MGEAHTIQGKDGCVGRLQTEELQGDDVGHPAGC